MAKKSIKRYVALAEYDGGAVYEPAEGWLTPIRCAISTHAASSVKSLRNTSGMAMKSLNTLTVSSSASRLMWETLLNSKSLAHQKNTNSTITDTAK